MAALRSHFGFPAFRPGQREAIEYVLAKRDALVVMPTGSGKSLCYQLPSFFLDGTTVVISPLIALMKDQVDALTAKNKLATFVNSTLTVNEQHERLARLSRGEYKIVYVSPERLRNVDFLRALGSTRVALLAVDEAHCISQWGHDFRPDYFHLREFIPRVGKPPVLALTATATPDVQNDIVEQLNLARAERIVTGFNRPNLHLSVCHTPGEAVKLRKLKSLLCDNSSGIIYTGTRREAEEVAEFVNEVAHIPAAFYHAGLGNKERTQVQDAFLSNKFAVMVATNAFGMGVDKPDIRWVVHYSLTSTVEAYYQEVGRAGRDGKPACITLLYSPEDRALQEWFIENDAPSPDQTFALYRALPRGITRVSLLDLQRIIGLSDTRLGLALRQLEIAGALERLGDERGTMILQVANIARLDLTAGTAEIERFRELKRRKLVQMIHYAETDACRRRFILDYFGDHGPADAFDCCDNHTGLVIQPTQRAESEDEWTPLVILETVRTLTRPLGREKIAMIVRGSRAQEIITYGYHRHRFYGKLKHLTLYEIGQVIDQLIVSSYLKTMGGKYPVVALTPQGKQALDARAAITLNVKMPACQQKRAEKKAVLKVGGTVARTLELVEQGLSVRQVAEMRGLAVSTIYGHLERLVADGKIAPDRFIEVEVRERILAAMKQWDGQWLSDLKALLPEQISYDQIRFIVVAQQAKQIGMPTSNSAQIPEDPVSQFLSQPHVKSLSGPWQIGFSLDWHSKFVGAQKIRTELGDLLYRFKYGGEQNVVDRLAARLADFVHAHAEIRADLIIPIPSTKKNRSYDPVLLLARALGKKIDIPVSETVLVKMRATRVQKEMTNLAQKQANVLGAFGITDANAVRGARVLLLDDFFDSGMTLAEATHILRAAGAADVCVLTVTKTIHTD